MVALREMKIPLLFRSAEDGTYSTDISEKYLDHYEIQSGGTQNNYVEYPVSLDAGTWAIHLYTRRGPNRCIITFAIDGSSVGTIDLYNGSYDTASVLRSLTGVAIASAGNHLLRLTAATKNASSSSYYMVVTGLRLIRTGS